MEIALPAAERLIGDSVSDLQSGSSSELSWFCVRSRTRQEHVAAASLRRIEGMEVVNPRIRFRRGTTRGPIWVIESMFPGYVFARFNLKRSLDTVQHTFGVAGVVRFGRFWPVVPNETIEGLRSMVGDEEVRLVEPALQVGQEVELAGGVMSGFHGVVTRVMPARDRVAVLLDFLGRQTTVELPLHSVSHDGPRYILRAA